jgi:hypothetical protein
MKSLPGNCAEDPMSELEMELERALAAHTEGVQVSPDLIERTQEELARRRHRQRARAVIGSSALVGAVIATAVVIAGQAAHDRSPGRTIIEPNSPSPSPTTTTTRQQAVAQAVLGARFRLVDSESPIHPHGVGTVEEQPGTIEEWKAPNGDLAQITWQADNRTLEANAPPNHRTAAGNRYYIQHGGNGMVSIVMYGEGHAVIYTRADPNVNPRHRRPNGNLVSDVPNDRTLLHQAAELLTAS